MIEFTVCIYKKTHTKFIKLLGFIIIYLDQFKSSFFPSSGCDQECNLFKGGTLFLLDQREDEK